MTAAGYRQNVPRPGPVYAPDGAMGTGTAAGPGRLTTRGEDK